MNTYEDIKTLLTTLDSIANAPEFKPMPEADEFDINTSNFSNGIYYIRINSNGGQLVKEFYKN